MTIKPTADNLREMMRTMYPEVDKASGDSMIVVGTVLLPASEHPMTAVGTVLLAGALFGITDEEALVRFTGYSKPFIAAILFNLRGNRVLNNGSYTSRGWLSPDGAIDREELWDHIEAACGYLWLEDDFEPLQSCQIYWESCAPRPSGLSQIPS